jgi:hypothetical protein
MLRLLILLVSPGRPILPALAASLALWIEAGLAPAADKTIGVFVALADNETQGIVPVPKAIGDGDDPEKNLYWGTADGLKGCFDRSDDWKLVEKDDAPAGPDVLRSRTYRHRAEAIVIRASAYRGSALKKCLQDFEAAVALGSYDLVVYIGHNGLMDFDLPIPSKSPRQARTPDCAVLCCRSEAYFKARMKAAGCRPVLLTTQLMYPGAFILRAIAAPWAAGSGAGKIRESAAAAYAENQKISRKAALGVFAAPDPERAGEKKTSAAAGRAGQAH